MTVYVFSTQPASGYFNVYHPRIAGQKNTPNRIAKSIHIKGGNGVAFSQKLTSENFDPNNIAPSLYTPRGMVTEVSDEDFEILLQNKAFKEGLDNKLFSYEKKKIDVEKKISKGELLEKDERNAPLEPQGLKADSKGAVTDKRLQNKEYGQVTTTQM